MKIKVYKCNIVYRNCGQILRMGSVCMSYCGARCWEGLSINSFEISLQVCKNPTVSWFFRLRRYHWSLGCICNRNVAMQNQWHFATQKRCKVLGDVLKVIFWQWEICFSVHACSSYLPNVNEWITPHCCIIT